MPQTRPLALACALAAVAGLVALAFVVSATPKSGANTASAMTPVDAFIEAASHPAAAHVASGERPANAVVAVSVAEVWAGRHKVRSVDRPALLRPARLGAWLRDMTFGQRSHLFRRLATQVRYGEKVVVLGARGELTRVRIPDQRGGGFPTGIIGWVASRQLAPQPSGWEEAARVATVTAKQAELLSYADGRVRTLPISYATTLPVIHAWRHRVIVAIPGPVGHGTLARRSVRIHKPGTPVLRPNAHEVVAQARRFLGLPYLWAGMTSWGYDCSGLTSTVFSMMGITLPRDAADQSLVGRPVARGHLRPGDLVFFSHVRSRGGIHHVAIYAGHGRVLQSPYTGARVEITRLRGSYLNREYWGATRLVH